MQLAAIYEVPDYPVIFTNLQTESFEGYAEMAHEMERLGREQWYARCKVGVAEVERNYAFG